MKTLVAYFSISGNTAAIAKQYAADCGADLFEIVPVQPYTAEDIDYNIPTSRVNQEVNGNLEVPVAGKVADFEGYEQVLIGFPIWYGCAPNVVSTFCAQYDWSGKKVVAFATSAMSPIGDTAAKLCPSLKGAESLTAVLVKSADDLKP